MVKSCELVGHYVGELDKNKKMPYESYDMKCTDESDNSYLYEFTLFYDDSVRPKPGTKLGIFDWKTSNELIAHEIDCVVEMNEAEPYKSIEKFLKLLLLK
jgi:hypothetical protein